MNDIEKALTVFQGISSRDPALATRYMHPAHYVEHDPSARDGVGGVKQDVEQVATDHAEWKVIRAFQDGAFVFTQTDGPLPGSRTFFDVFRFEDGLIVEHWSFSAQAAPPNKSGHTQVDGPTKARADADTGKNKSLIREYYEAVHIAGRHNVIPRYVSGDRMVRHEPGVADGVGEFMRDLEVLTRDRTIDRIRLLLGQGDFVFIAAEGTHQGAPCAYIDLYRVEDDRIAEHWGFPEPFPSPEARRNDNGML